MKEIKKILISCSVFILFLIIVFPVFSQETPGSSEGMNDLMEVEVPGEELNPYAQAKRKYENSLELYKAGEYETSRNLVNMYIQEFEQQHVEYPALIKGKFYLLKSMLAYAFRDQGYKEEIEELFLKAVTVHTDLDIREEATVSPFLIELYTKIKEEYLSQFTKTARRHTIGIVCSFMKDDTSIIQPGIHYSFNITDFLNISTNLKCLTPVGFPEENTDEEYKFLDNWRIKSGLTWYPEFIVENLVFGISLFHILSIDNLELAKNSISFCGHGEVFFRTGLGFGADVEVLRLDINHKEEDIEPLAGESDQLLYLFFANIDIYVLFTF